MAENANLRLWNRFADIDPQHTKPITGKPYKGTSPKPQYMIRLLTEMFGPVGQGFGWTVEAEGFQPIGEEVLHWCRIEFWWREEPEGVPNIFEAYGQTKARMQTKSGMMMDEDAPKKSLTDAITKAASQIGIASNLFMGRWDDSRYVEEVNREFRQAEKAEKAPAQLPAPAREPENGAKPRDPEKIAASLIAKVGEAQTRDDFDRTLGLAKFDEAWAWLASAAPAIEARVKQAVEAKRAALEDGDRAFEDSFMGGR